MPDTSSAVPATGAELGAELGASLGTRLRGRAFTITAEIAPPLSADPQALLALAGPLRGRADAINVTDAAGARTAISSLAAAAVLRAAGYQPILQMTCRDRNRIALAGDLLGAAALGIENILILRGDDPTQGDAPEAKPVFDLDSREVMGLARRMRDEGVLPSGRKIDAPPHYLIGAADSPHDPAADWRPEGLMAKRDAGAQFVQTQFCFNAEIMRRYMARLSDFGLCEELRFLVGVGPLASAGVARWMNRHLFGVEVPEATIARLEGAGDQAAEGRRICVELIEDLRGIDGVAGVHIMAPRQGTAAIAAVVDGLNLDR